MQPNPVRVHLQLLHQREKKVLWVTVPCLLCAVAAMFAMLSSQEGLTRPGDYIILGGALLTCLVVSWQAYFRLRSLAIMLQSCSPSRESVVLILPRTSLNAVMETIYEKSRSPLAGGDERKQLYEAYATHLVSYDQTIITLAELDFYQHLDQLRGDHADSFDRRAADEIEDPSSHG